VFLIAAMLWLGAMALGLLCMPQKGHVRKLGVLSMGINIAAAVLVACTIL
jgi:hypothetical protein